MQTLHNEDDYYEALCEKAGIDPVKGGRKLERALRGRRLLLLLDEIEKMTWDGFSHNLRAELRGLAEGEHAPFKLALVARSPLDRLFPDSELNTSPLAGICQQINVKPWNNATARTFIQQRLSGTPVRFSDDEIKHLVLSSNGLPLRLMHLALAVEDVCGVGDPPAERRKGVGRADCRWFGRRFGQFTGDGCGIPLEDDDLIVVAGHDHRAIGVAS